MTVAPARWDALLSRPDGTAAAAPAGGGREGEREGTRAAGAPARHRLGSSASRSAREEGGGRRVLGMEHIRTTKVAGPGGRSLRAGRGGRAREACSLQGPGRAGPVQSPLLLRCHSRRWGAGGRLTPSEACRLRPGLEDPARPVAFRATPPPRLGRRGPEQGRGRGQTRFPDPARAGDSKAGPGRAGRGGAGSGRLGRVVQVRFRRGSPCKACNVMVWGHARRRSFWDRPRRGSET